MHNSVLSRRNHASHARMLITAQLVAEHLKIDPLKVEALTPKGKDKDVRLMRQREAVADLLDDIALSLGIAVPAPGAAEVPVGDQAGEDAGGDQDPDGDQYPDGDQAGEDAGGDQDPDGDQYPDGDQAGESASSAELPPPVVDDEE